MNANYREHDMTDYELHKLQQDVSEIRVALIGLSGQGGLAQRINGVCEAVEDNRSRINNLERIVNRIWGYMIGCGLIGAGTAVGVNQIVRVITG